MPYEADVGEEYAEYLASQSDFRANGILMANLGNGRVRFGQRAIDEMTRWAEHEDGCIRANADGIAEIWLGGTPHAIEPAPK